jgi:hypothetical protein
MQSFARVLALARVGRLYIYSLILQGPGGIASLQNYELHPPEDPKMLVLRPTQGHYGVVTLREKLFVWSVMGYRIHVQDGSRFQRATIHCSLLFSALLGLDTVYLEELVFHFSILHHNQPMHE